MFKDPKRLKLAGPSVRVSICPFERLRTYCCPRRLIGCQGEGFEEGKCAARDFFYGKNALDESCRWAIPRQEGEILGSSRVTPKRVSAATGTKPRCLIALQFALSLAFLFLAQ